MSDKINVALVGLSFGTAFLPIYKDHPEIGEISICDTNPVILKEIGDLFGIYRRFPSLEDILEDNSIDAVHLITPIFDHEEQTIRVLMAGKHCACTVPMATSIEGIRRIIGAVKASGKNYMIMETSVYTRQFLYANEMNSKGQFGKIQFLRGAHYQDMEYWPDYWRGLPPMWYSTHAVAPLLAISGTSGLEVHCYGSGKMREELVENYNNPYPIETAIFDLGEGLKAEVTRSLFETAKMYSESFHVIGDKSTFEWQQIEEEDPLILTIGGKNIDENGVIWRGKKVAYQKAKMPEFHARLPEPIRKYTIKGKYYDETNPQNSIEAGGGHGGAHPYMVHEFVSSILENRKPWCDEIAGANWTAPGICAHVSAMNHGMRVEIPQFDV